MRRAALLYLLLTVCLAWPLSAHPATTVLSDAPDTNLVLWILGWDAHAFLRQPFSLFDANIYFPEAHTLAFSENLIGSAVLAAPIIWLTRNLVLAMNLVALGSAVLCGVGTYRLARRLGVGDGGALIAGAVFAFAPPRFLRLDQLHLATIQWVPFGLASLHDYLADYRPRDLRLFLAFVSLQALTSGHGAVFLLLGSAIILAYHAVLDERRLIAVGRVRDIGLGGALLLLPVVAVMIPYRQVQVGAGLRRTLENWTVTPESFLASPSHAHAWLLGVFHASRVNDVADTYLFPGFVALALALAGLASALPQIRRRSPNGAALGRRGHAAIVYGLVATVCLLMATGPRISLWPFVYWLPGLNFIRAPSRFMMMSLLGVAVLAGIGFDVLTAGMRRRAVVAALVVALLVGEYATMPFGLTSKTVETPAIDRWLSRRPEVRAIAEVPLVDARHLFSSEMRHTSYMLHTTSHWRKTVEGYSGIRPAPHERLYGELVNFPDDTSLRSLVALGVTHVVVHTDLYEPDEWPVVEGRIQAFSGWLRLERIADAGRVYSIHQP